MKTWDWARQIIYLDKPSAQSDDFINERRVMNDSTACLGRKPVWDAIFNHFRLDRRLWGYRQD